MVPLRFDLPEGGDPLTHVLNNLGSSLLLETRQRTMRRMYDSPGTTLTPREREGMRIISATGVSCETCSAIRLWRDWPGFSPEPIEEEFYENAIARNYSWEGFSKREALMVEFAERFENDIAGINGDDQLWERVHSLLSQAEIGDMLIMLGSWSGTGRATMALGIGSVCSIVPPSREKLDEAVVNNLQSWKGAQDSGNEVANPKAA